MYFLALSSTYIQCKIQIEYKGSPMSEKISRSVARLVLRAPVVHPKTGVEIGKEVLLTLRPGWSNLGAYELTIPGGKIEPADFAFQPVVQFSQEEFQAVGMRTAVREISEELGICVAHNLIEFVLKSTNELDWTTLVYAADLDTKPTLQVVPDSAGTLWLPEVQLLQGFFPIFADHGEFIVAALAHLSRK